MDIESQLSTEEVTQELMALRSNSLEYNRSLMKQEYPPHVLIRPPLQQHIYQAL